jgi:hypothetical protein
MGERTESPAPRSSLVAVGRSNYRVHVEEISLWQFAFLKACNQPTPSYSAYALPHLRVKEIRDKCSPRPRCG